MGSEPGPLVKRARGGDHRARELLAKRASILALRTASVLVGSREQALDIAQDAAYDAVRGLDKLKEPAAFDAWVHRITSRHARRAIRKKALRRRRELPLAMAAEASNPGTSTADRLAARSSLGAALAALPARQRIAIALRYVHDLDDEQIAAALGCRVGTVHSMLSRARGALRRSEQLQGLGPQEQATPEGVGR